ncbi:hypothetical protein EQ875_02025 [Photobacterium damselae subsp. damselae]|uniref:AAA family ATPase n=2 Tax=Gammaproteobacteria TaxID=1236 RepID=UPI00109BD4F8|nr:AAA family ATPase [Photobacterium damselae]TGZ34616.1 hypothetical protein EQ875_02025 [Photobacterium damselae subsp. damselae]
MTSSLLRLRDRKHQKKAEEEQKKIMPKIKRFNYRLKKLHIDNLKGIHDLTINFEENKNVTAIVGINGSGKSTIIHALACAFKPKGKQTSKDYNRLSHFFTPNKDATWDNSSFTLDFEYYANTSKLPKPALVSGNQKFHKKPSKKQSRWLPIYGRRHERESAYIGLHDLATLNEDKNASRYKEYETIELAHEAADQIKQDMIYILGRNYASLKSCTNTKAGKVHSMFGLEYNGIFYSEHSMGAGEKRVLNILSMLHSPKLRNDGLLLIDEIDVLLHGAAFTRLIERIISRSKQNKIEVVFSTHRETITDFKEEINIIGIFNTGNGVLPMPHSNPQIMSQLAGKMEKPLQICVEDELAEDIVLNYLYSRHLHAYVEVVKFGAYTNAFALLAGKKLMGMDIHNTICVLDGDVCRRDKERETVCKRHLNGNDKTSDRIGILEQIKEFKIKYFAPQGQKGTPEYNLKKIFEESQTSESRLQELQSASRGILELSDWHDYFDKIVESSGQRQARAKVLEFLQEQDEWNNYIKEISQWLETKATELNIPIK